MFNPCYPFTMKLLEAMLQKGVVWYVRSTYQRGFEKDLKQVFLISHYHEQAEAERHYNAIEWDAGRKLYNAAMPDALEALKIAASETVGYKVYSRIILPENEARATALFRENTKRYLYTNTNWNLKGKRVTIFPKMYFQLGELFVKMTFEGDTIEVKFEDLENS